MTTGLTDPLQHPASLNRRGDTGDFARLRSLVLRVQAGDPLATRQLLAELYPWLRAYYRRRLASDMIDDAVQETAMAVHRNCCRYDGSRPFACWLVTIASRKWADQLRQMHRHPRNELPGDLADVSVENGIVATLSTERLLERLRPAQSTAIRMVKLSGLSVAEAAAATGQSTSLIKVNIHRGLATLRRWVDAPPTLAGP